MGPTNRNVARTVGLAELQAFSDAAGEVAAEMARLRHAGLAALAVTAVALQAGDASSALGASVTGASIMLDGRQAVLTNFEIAAFNFLGERHRDGESLPDYVERIAMLDEIQLLGLQRSNGITLRIAKG